MQYINKASERNLLYGIQGQSGRWSWFTLAEWDKPLPAGQAGVVLYISKAEAGSTPYRRICFIREYADLSNGGQMVATSHKHLSVNELGFLVEPSAKVRASIVRDLDLANRSSNPVTRRTTPIPAPSLPWALGLEPASTLPSGLSVKFKLPPGASIIVTAE